MLTSTPVHGELSNSSQWTVCPPLLQFSCQFPVGEARGTDRRAVRAETSTNEATASLATMMATRAFALFSVAALAAAVPTPGALSKGTACRPKPWHSKPIRPAMQLVREASRPERHEHERTAMHIDPLPNDRERESSLPMSKGCPNLCVCASNAVRRLQGTAGSAYEVSTNGATVDASIDAAAGQSWFAFTAAEGFTYQIETVLGTLDDTVVDLVDTDQSTVLVENDDDERSADSYASYIEWTCPQDGRYFIMVKGYGRATGTFSVMVTEGAGGAGGVGGSVGLVRDGRSLPPSVAGKPV